MERDARWAGLAVAVMLTWAVSAPAQETGGLVRAASPAAPQPNATGPVVPQEKATTLGLYLTSKEAFAKWQGDPEKVKILDVRTTEEFLFVGHAAMAWNVPAFLQVYEWDTEKQRFPMRPNPEFAAQVRALFQPTDTILVTCRSGGRSALAVNQLAEAGFTTAYNIVDGVEGDAVTDPDSVFVGQRLRNGWKNSGLPWTFDGTPARMALPEAR